MSDQSVYLVGCSASNFAGAASIPFGKGRASIPGSATLCFSRWTERRGCQLHRFQYRRKHRAGFLTKKALRCRRPVRPGEEKVVHGGEALSLAWQIESS